MPRSHTAAALAAAATLLSLLPLASAHADEGMWTYDNPPTKLLQQRYGFTPTADWLRHLQLSTVRFNSGGTGSFVSPDGLVLTNHHVARDQLQKISTPGKDYVRDGYLAHNREEELTCPDLELNVLMSMENVTARVQGAVKAGMSDTQAYDARQAAIAAIEKASTDATGLRSDVVTLYQGGEYWLYRYKRYTDVRLVFAPEVQIAFFGGDPDNFTYPRYDLDMALFRVYENGKPIKSPAYLRWNPRGGHAGDLVFVSGHPGTTDRLVTMAQLLTMRDYSLPLRLTSLRRILSVAQEYAKEGPEEARETEGLVFGTQNAIKAVTGQLNGLRDPDLMAAKATEQKALQEKVAADPALEKKYGDAWTAISQVQDVLRSRMTEYSYRKLQGYRLPTMALTIVQYVEEITKPNGERLDGFHDSQLESLRYRLFSTAPVYRGVEEALLANGLQQSLEALGRDDPFVRAALQGRTPQQVAHEAIDGTRLTDPEVRRQLIDGGEKAVQASDDPLIALARRVEPSIREMRTWYDNKVKSVEIANGAKIGAARFALYGTSTYPDATFTLRLSYGTIKGYPMNGTIAPPRTTFYGLYDRSYGFEQAPPFNLPARWSEGRGALDLSTPLDFVSTCDIVGGNSGSPVVDRNGELVGLIFDGNIESLVGRFVYDERDNRAVAVHAAAMLEAMKKLYGADYLVNEIMGKGGAGEAGSVGGR
jgi:hypothetical protein